MRKSEKTFLSNFISKTTVIFFVCFVFISSAQADTFVVNSTGDEADANTADNICETTTTGECTLRAAIQQTNQTAGADTINFNIAPFDGTVKTITPLSPLPDITQTVTIDGYTQQSCDTNPAPCSKPNTLAVGSDAVLLIEINGGSQGTGDLLHLFADNNVVRGLIVNRAPFDGIFLGNPSGVPTSGNVIEGNFIGTDSTGTMARGNGRFGVSLFFYPSSNNQIGGVTPAARNLISGNGQGGIVFGGIVFGGTGSSNNVVSGNYIGTNASGTAALQNNIRGVYAGNGANNNRIGGATAGERNVISGNGGSGVELLGNGATNNDVRGNFIGIAADGIAALGNAGFGVDVRDTATGNRINSNLISANGNIGINLGDVPLGGSAVTPNDANDADTGANNLQNFPVLSSAVKNGGSTTVQGTLNSTPNISGFVIEFFTNAVCDASGNGEGQRFLGSTTVNTDSAGNASFNQTFAVTTASGEAATAIATDPNGNTSEFSQCRTITGTQQTFIVTNTNDAGAGSLRQAVADANANTLATDTISFNIPGAGVRSIALLSPLPDITDPVIIDGYTQPGSSPNTNPLTMGSNAVLLVELNGMNAGAGDGKDGLRLLSGNSTVRGLIINRFADDGINIVGDSDNNVIQGNFIGTDASGTMDFGNAGAGISSEISNIGLTPTSNLIGGIVPAARNVVSGNGGSGIEFEFAADNVIRGNLIGLSADGSNAIGNGGSGIVAGAFTSGTIIGGDDAADGAADGAVNARNYVSGNQGGIFAGGAAFGGATIRGNFIGTDVTGTIPRPNGTGIGTNIAGGLTIGGSTQGAGNLISGNTGDGIFLGNTGNAIVRGNRIGTTANGVNALGNGGNGIQIFAGGSNNGIGGIAAGEGNTIAFNSGDGVYIDASLNPVSNSILSNSIFSNGGLGIDLGADGVTPNDAGDADTGANNQQNYPVITFARSGSTRVVGTFNSTANRTFRLEFFNSEAADASGNGEGQTFIGAANVTTDANGDAAFDQTFAPNSPVNSFVSATAIDLTTGDTSEFSVAKQVFGTTAASVSVSGRVLTAANRGVSGARIVMTDASGNVREARTNTFGYYNFAAVAAGATYVFTITHKRYVFAPQVVFVGDDLNEFNFAAFPKPAADNL